MKYLDFTFIETIIYRKLVKSMFKKILNFLLKEIILFLIGGFLYYFVEISVRGFSHWTMIIVGGLCFIIMGLINELFTFEIPLSNQVLISAAIITIIEFISGCILNLKLGLNIWDYSNKPFNLLGQICIENCCYWIILSIIGIVLDDYLRYWFFKEEKPHYKII